MNLLKKWGLNPELVNTQIAPGDVLARVIEEHRSQYRIITEEGELIAQVRGKLRDGGTMPLVGDFVTVRPLWSESKAVIQEVLPRKNVLHRRDEEKIESIAANIHAIFILTSLNKDFNEKRIDRYLTIIHESQARAYIVLTKSDLEVKNEEWMAQVRKRFPGIEIFIVSAVSGEGVSQLAQALQPQETILFIGSSGVGKSTLVNALLGKDEQATQSIREEDGRGRHTTTSRRLLPLPNGAIVIDTPGWREIQLSHKHEMGLEESFPQIEALAVGCKFVNCQHDSEPGCAIKAALAAGEIDSAAYESFLKLQKELAFQTRKNNKALQAEEKKKWKSVSKLQRAGYKNRRSEE